MKISLVSRLNSASQKWHSRQLKEAAAKRKIEFEVINPTNFNQDKSRFSSTNVLFWRSGDISKLYPTVAERVRLLSHLNHQGIIIINKTLWTHPYLSYKSVQQEYIQQRLAKIIAPIPTYRAKDLSSLKALIKNKILNYPFIAKLNHGSQGRGTVLISKTSDLNNISQFNLYVYQNFIPNDGDYRILVAGGTSIGLAKRVRREHPFLNNISQGGRAEAVEDSGLKQKLVNIASKISTNLDLIIAGVDLIYHQKEKKWYFLELNTVCQWQGLQKISPFNIGQKIIEVLADLTDNQKPEPKSVAKYYFNRLEFLSKEKQTHFLVRFHFINPNSKILAKYPLIKQVYPDNLADLKKLTQEYIDNYQKLAGEIMANKNYRKGYLKKYPWLGAFNKIFLTFLFSKNLYGLDPAPLASLLDQSKINQYQQELLANPTDILTLPSHAVNFLYFIKLFLVKIDQPWSADDLLKIARQAKNNRLSLSEQLSSRIYLLTHAIIGASQFYNRPIKAGRGSYLKIIHFLEKLILDHYILISLDLKLEFLVCAKLLNYRSNLEKIILTEVGQSKSDHGCYLVDKFNIYRHSSILSDLEGSEHRNILYLMTQLPDGYSNN